MAKFGKWRNPLVEINSVDLSSFFRSAQLNITRSTEDHTGGGTGEYMDKTVSRAEWSFTFELWQSFYTAEVDATLWPLINAPGSGITVKVRPNGGSAVGSTNPDYSGTCYSTDYSPTDGSNDENLSTSITFEGSGALTRATS